MPPQEQERAANEKALREVQEGAEGPQHDDVLELKEDEPDEGAEPEAQAPSRQQKKSNRYREATERAERAETEAADLRARLAAQEEIRRALPQASPAEQKDPHQEKIASLRKQQEDLIADFDAMTPEGKKARLGEFRKRWQDLDTDVATTIAERAAAKGSPQGGLDPQRAAEIAALRVRYSDVVNHPKGGDIINWASGQWGSLLARARSLGQATPGQAEMDRIIEEGRRLWGLVKPPAANRGTVARFAGTGPRSAAPPSRDDDGKFQIVGNKKQHMKMARAAFPNLPEDKALQKYLNLMKDA
jgi:hypothetical protein